MDFETTVEIAASPERVWDVHVDVESWPDWTESMSEVRRLDSGQLQVGSKARIKQPGMPSMVWEITLFEPNHRFSWGTSRVGMKLMADHVITSGPDGATVTMTVRSSGLVARLTEPFTVKKARHYVDLEAKGLKKRCEEPS